LSLFSYKCKNISQHFTEHTHAHTPTAAVDNYWADDKSCPAWWCVRLCVLGNLFEGARNLQKIENIWFTVYLNCVLEYYKLTCCKRIVTRKSDTECEM